MPQSKVRKKKSQLIAKHRMGKAVRQELREIQEYKATVAKLEEAALKFEAQQNEEN